MAARYQCAFTLIELLTVLAVLSILVAVVAPATGRMHDAARKTALTNDFISTLNFARATAIMRRQPVQLCGGEQACVASRKWQQALIVTKESALPNSTQDPLKVTPLPSDYHWAWAGFQRSKTTLLFLSNGVTNDQNGSFILCKKNQPVNRVTINKTGRSYPASLRKTDRCDD